MISHARTQNRCAQNHCFDLAATDATRPENPGRSLTFWNVLFFLYKSKGKNDRSVLLGTTSKKWLLQRSRPTGGAQRLILAVTKKALF